MGKFGKELIESMQQAVGHAGKRGRKPRVLKNAQTGKALTAAMQASPHRETDLAPKRAYRRMLVRKVSV